MPKKNWVLLLAALLAAKTAHAQTNVWGQKKDTYNFNKSASDLPKKLPKALPGRIHLRDGRTLAVPIAYLDYNKLVAIEPSAKTVYTPLEVSSFVMKQDSFIVLRDFKVAIGADEQEFRMAFVRVGAVGPGYALYQFRGTMRREIGASLAPGGMGWVEESTQYLPSKVWFIKRDNDPRWLSLPYSGGTIRNVVEPIIADDKKLTRSVDWEFLSADGVQDILREYAANRSAALR